MADPRSNVILAYRGDGSGRIPGVPRRGLTAADVDRIPSPALREALAARFGDGPLYEPVGDAALPVDPAAVASAPPATPNAPISETGDADDLAGMTRAALDALAASLDVDAPDSLPNKPAVIEAINARRAAGEGGA